MFIPSVVEELVPSLIEENPRTVPFSSFGYFRLVFMAEGVGFEPTTPISEGKRLAGARTRPLCDPSSRGLYYSMSSGTFLQ